MALEDPGKDGEMKDMERPSIHHLLTSLLHSTFLPAGTSGVVFTSGSSWSFSKMPNWQLTIWYYLRAPTSPPYPGLQIFHC